MDQFKTIWTKMKAKKDAEEGEDNMSALELSSSDNKTNGGVFVPPVPTGNSMFQFKISPLGAACLNVS